MNPQAALSQTHHLKLSSFFTKVICLANADAKDLGYLLGCISTLEQIRFGDEVNVVYDIQTANFRLPPLTVQPLAENAVKHGLNKKRGSGTVTISTAVTEDSFVIIIADDGRGFDLLHYMDDGLPHIGINNDRQRLQHMVGGMLEITSSGEGTTAVVTLPRKEAGLYHEDHRS